MTWLVSEKSLVSEKVGKLAFEVFVCQKVGRDPTLLFLLRFGFGGPERKGTSTSIVGVYVVFLNFLEQFFSSLFAWELELVVCFESSFKLTRFEATRTLPYTMLR